MYLYIYVYVCMYNYVYMGIIIRDIVGVERGLDTKRKKVSAGEDSILPRGMPGMPRMPRMEEIYPLVMSK